VQELHVDLQDVLTVVTHYYLKSGDFNGISARELAATLKVDWSVLHSPLQQLIAEGKVGVLFADTMHNTHIIRLGFEPEEVQIGKLATVDLFHTCIYPRPLHLRAIVDPAKYSTEPYKLCLALGEPQLAYRVFDLSVLEAYRNDPRYHYSTNDIRGRIYIKTESAESPQFPESDKILLETFGFAYDDDLNRAVAVFLRYLVILTPEHQQIWKAKEISGNYKLHEDYYRTSIVGDFPKGNSIFTALSTELALINKMADAMGRPRFFREDFGREGSPRPRNFGFLVRPTLEEFNNFILTLDKLLSDNIKREFFAGDVPFESETVRKDGKIIVQPKGSLQLLNEWISDVFGNLDPDSWEKAYKALRRVRELRQKPAHALDENVFDQQYFKKQRDVIEDAYKAVRTLRELLESHPSVMAANIKVPPWIQEGRIWII
jgi:hypothetical protein